MTDQELMECLEALPSGADRSWAQGIADMVGIRFKQWDYMGCQSCGYTYGVNRRPHFRRDGITEFIPGPDPGCPKCAEKTA